MKKTAAFLAKWGHYLLALLCAGVIVLSAVWAENMQPMDAEDFPAGANQAQRLEDAQKPKDTRQLLPPVEGKILRPFSQEILYDASLGIWLIHPAVDFETEAGEAVRAMAAGVAEATENQIVIRHENGDYSVYRGLARIEAEEGKQVKAGERIGTAGASVPMEGELLCIGYYIQDVPVDFTPLLINQ